MSHPWKWLEVGELSMDPTPRTEKETAEELAPLLLTHPLLTSTLSIAEPALLYIESEDPTNPSNRSCHNASLRIC